MDAISADQSERKLLLKGRRLRVMSEGESRLIVWSRPSWIYAGLMAVMVVLTMFMVLLGGMMFFLGLFPPKPDPVQDGFRLLLGTFCTLLFLLMHGAVIYLFLKLAFPKVTVIDLATATVRLRHLPGFSRDLPLASVASVDLVMLTEKGTCHLGFTEVSTGIVRSIHGLGGSTIRSPIATRCCPPPGSLPASATSRWSLPGATFAGISTRDNPNRCRRSSFLCRLQFNSSAERCYNGRHGAQSLQVAARAGVQRVE